MVRETRSYRLVAPAAVCCSILATVGLQAQPPAVVVWYLGNVAPDAPDAAGPGVNFVLFNGIEQGKLVYDATAGDYKAWYILDSNTARTKYRVSNPVDIECDPGATIVARVRVPMQSGSKGANLAIYDTDGGTAGYFWGGASVPTPGLIRDSYHATETSIAGDADYHILRLTMSGGSAACPGVNRVVNLYFDENPTPALVINPAGDATDDNNPPDSFGFGCSNTSGRQEIYFDWVTASNQGAFAPGAEVAVLGKSLVPVVTLPACELSVVPAVTQTATAIQGQPATPAQISFTPFNSGQAAISYTVAKVPDDASTAWLIVPAGGGPLNSGQIDTVTASLNTTGLGIGMHSVDLRFTSTCVPPTEVTRTVQLTVSGNMQVDPNPGFTVPAETVGPQARTFTVTNVGLSGDLNYTVTKLDVCDWMTLDKPGGGPISPGSNDGVTVTVNPAGISTDQTCRLRFTNSGNPAETVERTVTVDVLESLVLLSYWGDVRPDDPNSFLPDHTFSLANGADDADQGSLIDDPAALDGKAWRIADDGTHKTRWYSVGAINIYAHRGATIVGRVAVESVVGNLRPGNLLVREDAGLSAEAHFTGPHSTQTRAGRVSEAIRVVDSPPDASRANSDYHIMRMTVIGGPGTGLNRIIRIYIDEQPTPVVEIPDASEDSNIRDQFGFGVNHVGVAQTMKFDYVRATTVGAFAPGEDCGVLGECLVLPEAGACCMADQSCDVLWPALCAAADGQYMGIGTTCGQVSCPFRCHEPFADTDDDGDVDMVDFALWQLCVTATGPIPAEPAYCQCLDRDDGGAGDGDIDLNDLQKFMECGSGAAVPADPNCGL
ncbi:MAG: hypothetical protein HY718_08000 [Planctomycetes bacterium]|nr:hypothetical protein [Planctomycetota bacterium]